MGFPLHGFVASGFEAVRDVFANNFTEDVDVGASFCVVHRGTPIVDLWGGYQDRDESVPWLEDTLVNVYSTTKGLASMAVAAVVEDGLLDYLAPVNEYWPELRAARDGLTVAQLLSHQAGLCGVRTPITVADLYDWEKMCRLLENEEPFWVPGTAAGYHAVTWGYLAGELVRRTTGSTLGEVFRERIANPLAADFFIGLPTSESHRVAPIIGAARARIQPDPVTVNFPVLHAIALENPIIRPYADASSQAWQQAEIAAASGQANARGIARIYGALAVGGECDGVRVLKPETIAAMVEEEVGVVPDLVLGRGLRRGRGVILNTDQQFGANPQSYGHTGAGGSMGFADADAELGVGYAMNQMQNNSGNDTRGGRLLRAVYECLK